MGEEAEGKTEERVEKPERAEGLGFDLMRYLGESGLESLDPLTRFMVVQEMLDEWRERRDRRRRGDDRLTAEDVARIVEDVLDRRLGRRGEASLEDLMEKWEKRFSEFQSTVQSTIERLLLGRKVEEAERRAEEAERRLKETEEAKQQEEMIRGKVAEMLSPLQERIRELQGVIAAKTAGMTNEERRSFFERLGEEIEKAIGGEVTSTIAGAVRESLVRAFEKEAPVTPEGKVNWVRLVDRWVSKALDTINAIVSRMPQQTPVRMEVREMPVAAEAPVAQQQREVGEVQEAGSASGAGGAGSEQTVAVEGSERSGEGSEGGGSGQGG
jgi:hypothetical protein